MFHLSELLLRTVSALVLAPLVILLILYGGQVFAGALHIASVILLAILMMYEWTVMIQQWKSSNRAKKLLWTIVAILYTSIASYAMLHILLLNPYHMLWICGVVWATDIGAYCFGLTIKGPKICPAISPKKTWSGLCGGIICAIGFHLFFGKYFVLEFGPSWMLIVSMSCISQVGDFFESYAKRVFGVKNSGWVIPGHGGVLDRVDGLVAALIFGLFLGY